MAQRWAHHTTARALQPVLTVLDRRIERLARKRARQVLNESTEVFDLRTEVLQLRTELEKMRNQVRAPGYAVDLLLGSQGRRSTRLISEERLRELAAQVARASSAPDAYGRVVQAYRTLFELELRGVGRLAGGAPNILGKLATTPLLSPPNGEILEIGTLFGLFSGGMARQISRIGLNYQLTIIDPLADVQLQVTELKADTSGSPVTETVVRENLSLAGVDPKRMRLVKGFSEDPQVQAAVSDRQYGVIVIDGDHSATGVANDLRFAEKVAAPGGIVVLDDYGDRNWPGVQDATDNHLTGETRFDLVGVVATSAFLRAQPVSTVTIPGARTADLTELERQKQKR
ncbi:class I SAM-dependent methyltransferase [Kineosporia sp. J2-2]|uniref:Class I SAM-dependent methyltransferase n=1 Tax=Kineosporia corallincola TaxID=2835133 RepID=A0ABS5TN13_9ACTN|nr:class I SAM-dependent methyltransferase [Kineosporia corallincola]MBT0772485.1 class I SAM-dependent methyltransferase [Kineosporia corallincola]